MPDNLFSLITFDRIKPEKETQLYRSVQRPRINAAVTRIKKNQGALGKSNKYVILKSGQF